MRKVLVVREVDARRKALPGLRYVCCIPLPLRSHPSLSGLFAIY